MDRAWLRTPIPTLDFGSRGRPARSPPPPRGLLLLRRVSSSRILLSLALIARRAAMVELRSVMVTAWFPPRYFWDTFPASVSFQSMFKSNVSHQCQSLSRKTGAREQERRANRVADKKRREGVPSPRVFRHTGALTATDAPSRRSRAVCTTVWHGSSIIRWSAVQRTVGSSSALLYGRLPRLLSCTTEGYARTS